MGFSWGLLQVLFLILMLAPSAEKPFSLTSSRCPFRRRWGVKKKNQRNLGAARKVASPPETAMPGPGWQARSTTRPPSGGQATRPRWKFWAAVSHQRWPRLHHCGSGAGRGNPCWKSPHIGLRYTSPRTFQSAIPFPRRWTAISRQLPLEGGDSRWPVRQHPKLRRRRASNQSNQLSSGGLSPTPRAPRPKGSAQARDQGAGLKEEGPPRPARRPRPPPPAASEGAHRSYAEKAQIAVWSIADAVARSGTPGEALGRCCVMV